MNILRYAGDFTRLFALLFLIVQILRKRSINGISKQTQVLYALVVVTRYSDVFTNYHFLYNYAFKITYLLLHFFTLGLIFQPKFQDEKDKYIERMSVLGFMFVCAIMAFLINNEFTCQEVVWAFSIYLESVTIIPQLDMVYNHEETPNVDVAIYVAILSIYRSMYLADRLHRFFIENFYDPIVIFSCAIQLMIYFVFFGIYWMKKNVKNEEKVVEKNGLFLLNV